MSIFSLLFGLAPAAPLEIGAKAPAVSAKTDAGSTLNLGDVYKQNNYTLVWFYPRALTGGCTKQGCSLRDAHADLAPNPLQVVLQANPERHDPLIAGLRAMGLD